MTRVLMACEPPDGGVAEIAVVLACGLGAHGIEVEFAGPPDSEHYPGLRERGIAVHTLPLAPGYTNLRSDAGALRGLSRLLAGGRFDLVHCCSSKAGVVGRLAARARGVPAVFAPNAFSFVGDFGAARRLTATIIERALGHVTAAVVCCCEHERRLALEAKVAPPERLHVVFNSSQPCRLDESPDATLSALREGGPVVAAVASLRAQKTLDVFLDAAPSVLRGHPDARFALVGNGPLRAQLAAHAAHLGLDRDERFAMLPFSAPASRYLRAADLYVLPSAWEGFPVGVLEAQACGVPQVATDVGGTHEALTPDTGVLVPKGEAPALADAICELLGDPERRRAMAAASRQRYERHFKPEVMVANVARVYERLLDGA